MPDFAVMISPRQFFRSSKHSSFHLELTEFPKIDVSDDEDGAEKHANDNDDDTLSNSISSMSMDGLSLNNNHAQASTNSGMSNTAITSDYESFADCMRQSSITAAHAQIAKPLTNINFDNRFRIQSSARVNTEDLASNHESQRRRKQGTSSTNVIRKSGKTSTTNSINETPLLSHLFGTHKSNSDLS